MAISNARPGLPDPKSVVAEIPFSAPGEKMPTTEAPGAPPPRFRIIRTNEVDQYEKPPSKASVAESVFVEAPPPGDNFKGTSRKASKLFISDAKTEKFKDLGDLIKTFPAHKDMRKKKIATDAKSKRVPEENRNVRLTAFLYAASVEDDNDYHLIFGRDPDAGGQEVYMTMELSGLPPSNFKSRKALETARKAFKKFFQTNFAGQLPGKSYDFYDPPIRVDIEGSLFWDASHAKGSRPGPKSLRDKMPVVWEVHPIAKIKLFVP